MLILIADRELKVRNALSVLIQRQPGWMVAGMAEDAASMFSKAAQVRPDVVLLDCSLPGLSLDPLVRVLKHNQGVIVIAMSANPEMRAQALASGADDFICKVEPPQRVIEILMACERRLNKKSLPGLFSSATCLKPTPPQKI